MRALLWAIGSCDRQLFRLRRAGADPLVAERILKELHHRRGFVAVVWRWADSTELRRVEQ